MPYEKRCEQCGEPFRATRFDARTCSAKCRSALVRARRRTGKVGASLGALSQAALEVTIPDGYPAAPTVRIPMCELLRLHQYIQEQLEHGAHEGESAEAFIEVISTLGERKLVRGLLTFPKSA